MAFSEFYTDFTNGANINAGDKTANGVVTSTNGNWSTVTNIFTATGGTPFSGVSVGDFASLYLDGGTVAAYTARVTAIGGGGLTLTLSTTAISGNAPTTAATGVSCTTGGAWKGPNGAVSFPFGYIQTAMTNVAGDTPRVNMLGGTNYAVTAAMTHVIAGPVRFEGYTATVGDGGRAVIDGTIVGASYAVLTLSAANTDLVGLTVQNNGTSGSAAGIVVSGTENTVIRCVVNSVRGHGFSSTSGPNTFIECEAYSCNQSNAGSTAGFGFAASQATVVRCVSHDNSGSSSAGFICSTGSVFFSNCIADTNGGIGFNLSTPSSSSMLGCDSYNNTSDGIRIANSSQATCYIENCNLIKNGGWGINGSGAGSRNGAVVNCGFGSGTQTNSSGTTTGLKTMTESGSITYASNVTPWVDPANGDFRINLAASINAGRGTFTETAASYAGTIGYPDIGAAQHLETSVAGVTLLAPINVLI